MKWLFAAAAIALIAVMAPPIQAQAGGHVQELSGTIFPGELYYYRLDGLKAGQTLYVSLDEVTGNLDPVAAILAGNTDVGALEREYRTALAEAIADGVDPLDALQLVSNQFFLQSDDDSGEGQAAAFAFEVPADGDYGLIVAGALNVFGMETSGDYRLLIGIDAPRVLEGDARPTGHEIAVLDREATPANERVEELLGEITEETPEVTYPLADAHPGDVLQIYVEAADGNLRPSLVLSNFAGKPVASANVAGDAANASLSYTFEESARNFTLRVTGCCEDDPSTGTYRLLVGTNAPAVLDGQAQPTGEALVRKPVDVKIGVKLQQMIEVNESSEYYNAVVSLQMEWMAPDAAFSPDTCDCLFKTYTASNFGEFLDLVGIWPEFTIFNQQGNRWSQNRVGVVFSSGRVLYFERFTTNLQVDFDFKKYPFDTQQFTIVVDGVYPEGMFVFSDLPGFTEIAPDHGEDEFIITDWRTEVTSEQASTQDEVSRFTFSFTSPRHLEYYILQIFIPILLIMTVSYVTFFLRDYGRRIEVASANLLLFIAFSFSLADNYPHLGYITFLDALMAVIFVVNALVVIYNVWLRKLEQAGDEARIDRIDGVLDWVYPFALVAAFGSLYYWFVVR